MLLGWKGEGLELPRAQFLTREGRFVIGGDAADMTIFSLLILRSLDLAQFLKPLLGFSGLPTVSAIYPSLIN